MDGLEIDPQRHRGRDKKALPERQKARSKADHDAHDEGLAMELSSSVLLTYLDDPAEVMSYCAHQNGLPSCCAGSGKPDITVDYSGTGLRLVIEASIRYRPADKTWLAEQFDGAWRHALQQREDHDGPVYALLLNNADKESVINSGIY